jgi:hypothetical protein
MWWFPVLLGLSLVVMGHSNRWCEYIHNTPEPQLLVYNRIPRSASTFTSEMMDDNKMLNERLHTWHADESFWYKEYDTDKPARNRLYSTIKDQLRKVKTMDMLVVDGHWHFHSFSPDELDVSSIEYFQMIRDCRKQAKSWIVAKLNEVNATDDCRTSFSCLNSVLKSDLHYGMTTRYFCGADCIKKSGSLWEGASNNVYDLTHGITLVGVVEYLSETIEMLECAYPTAFRTDKSEENKTKLSSSSSSTSVASPTAPLSAIETMADKMCHEIDEPFYQVVKDLFWKRYLEMKANKEKCCRRRPF